jgi:hypothetical protein
MLCPDCGGEIKHYGKNGYRCDNCEPLAKVKLDNPPRWTEGECPHVLETGRHEWYIDPHTGPYCRRCGKESKKEFTYKGQLGQ